MELQRERIGFISAIVAAFALGYNWSKLTIPAPTSKKIIPSPRATLLQRLSNEQAQALPYPPDFLPGARDVTTPYGVMRVYEWGPVTGPKVLFVHGISTPAPMFIHTAHQLVERGYRVMLFDLWGRGYTDSPSGCQHDSTLFGLQILFAIASSPIAWTGEESGKFSLIGFSLGGSISLDFFRHFPDLVKSLVLLAPAGLLRNIPATYNRYWYRHPFFVSQRYMNKLIGTALGVRLQKDNKIFTEKRTSVTEFTPAEALQFQFDHHQGHIQSYLSTLQYGPITNQNDVWKDACDIIKGEKSVKSTLQNGRLLVICGDVDNVVPAADVREDLVRLLGSEEHFEFKIVPGNHGFPLPQGVVIANLLTDFWNNN